MIRGVIIWYSGLDGKALIWCEDSGALALAIGPASWRDPETKIGVGDCVGLRVMQRGRERIGSDIHLIASKVAPGLPQAIRPARKRPAKPELALVGSETPRAASSGEDARPAGGQTGAGATRPLGTGIPLLHLCASRD